MAAGALKHKAHGLTPFQLLAGAFGAWLEGDPALEGVFAFGEDHPLEVEGAPLPGPGRRCGREGRAREPPGDCPTLGG